MKAFLIKKPVTNNRRVKFIYLLNKLVQKPANTTVQRLNDLFDANGDGLCDTTGAPVIQNSGVENQGNMNGQKGNKGKGGNAR